MGGLNGLWAALLSIAILFPAPLGRVAHLQAYSPMIVAAFAPFIALYLGRKRAYWTPTTRAVWILRSIAIVLVLLAPLRGAWTPGDLVAGLGTLLLTFFYEWGVLLSVRPEFRNRYLWGLLLGFLCIHIPLVALLIQHFDLNDIGATTTALRQVYPSWPNYQAMIAAGYMVIALVLAGSRQYRKFSVVSIIFIGSIVALSASRTAVIAFLIAILYVGISKIRRRDRAASRNDRNIVFLLLVLIVVALIPLAAKEGTAANTTLRTLEGRFWRWMAALEVFLESPLIGSGLGSASDAVIARGPNTPDEIFGSTHNDYIDMLVRGGLLYTVAMMIVVLRGLRSLRGSWMQAILLLTLLAAVVQNPLKNAAVASLFWLALGLGPEKDLSTALDTAELENSRDIALRDSPRVIDDKQKALHAT